MSTAYYDGIQPIECKPLFKDDGSWAGFEPGNKVSINDESELFMDKSKYEIMPKTNGKGLLIHDERGGALFEWVPKAAHEFTFEFKDDGGNNFKVGKKEVYPIVFNSEWSVDKVYEENKLTRSELPLSAQKKIISIVKLLQANERLWACTDNDVVRLCSLIDVLRKVEAMVQRATVKNVGVTQQAQNRALLSKKRKKETEHGKEAVKAVMAAAREGFKGDRTPAGRKRKKKKRTKDMLLADWARSEAMCNIFYEWMAFSVNKQESDLTEEEKLAAEEKYNSFYNVANGKYETNVDTNELADFLIQLNAKLPKEKRLNIAMMLAPEAQDDSADYVNDEEAEAMARAQAASDED